MRPTWHRSRANTLALVDGFTGRADDLPAAGLMPAPFDAPYMQRALVEALLLAVLAGVLGSWIVLRRLAFFTHGVGHRRVPRPRRRGAARAWRHSLRRSAPRSVLRAGCERLTRTRRVATDAATGLLLVAALALGAILASDVFGSGAGVDRLLFGQPDRPHARATCG